MEENSVHLLKNGRTLGSRYVIEGVLGEGGFGITYRGHDKTLDVEVAIKEYYPQGFVTRNTTYRIPVKIHGNVSKRKGKVFK